MNYRYDDELAAAIPSLPNFDLENPLLTRERLNAARSKRPGPDATGVEVTERKVPGPEGAPSVRVRIYRPEDATGELPSVLNIHGGGFVLGELDIDDATCLDIARRVQAVVISVDYRRAPESHYPAALEDCYAVLQWLVGSAAEIGVDTARIVVHGRSAGACLATALTMLTRDRGGPQIIFQYLDLPELDDRLASLSMTRFTDTPAWHTPNALLSWRHYLGEDRAGGNDVPSYAAPARAEDLSGLPPAYIAAFEYDPLRDEAVAYAERLFAANVAVELHVFSGAYHLADLIQDARVTQRRVEERIFVLHRALYG